MAGFFACGVLAAVVLLLFLGFLRKKHIFMFVDRPRSERGQASRGFLGSERGQARLSKGFLA